MSVDSPAFIDWTVWRILTSKHLNVTLRDLERHWSFDDFLDAHDALSVLDEVEALAHKQAQEKGKRRGA